MLALNSNQSSQEKPGLSEVIIPSRESNSLDLMLPMLAHLSHQAGDRWLTWICSERHSKQVFESYGFSLSNVRVIHSPSDEQTLWIMWEALNNGTSSCVVGDFKNSASVRNKECSLLESACFNGNSRALVLKYPH